jgi:hypothetical protein
MVGSLKLLVYEHIAGGGYANAPISSSVLCEGYGMLRTFISDLKAAGHQVITFLDSRLARFNPPIQSDETICISVPEQVEETLPVFSGTVDAVHLTAPESDGILARLVRVVERSGALSLNCSSGAIAAASDKTKIYTTLSRSGLAVPQYVTIDSSWSKQKIHDALAQVGLPAIFKPVDGVGCAGLSFVKSRAEALLAVERAKINEHDSSLIVQKFVRGTAASVTLISTGELALPVTLNRQLLRLAPPEFESSYLGGIVPLHHQMEHEAFLIAKTAVESIEGLRGIVGVDMVLSAHGPVIIEVNPRLTTSYVGIRSVLNLNLAQAVLEAVVEHRLPHRLRTSGYAIFSKVAVPAFPNENLRRTYGMHEVIYPPFPTDGGTVYTLISVKSATPARARRKLSRARRHFQTILEGG